MRLSFNILPAAALLDWFLHCLIWVASQKVKPQTSAFYKVNKKPHLCELLCQILPHASQEGFVHYTAFHVQSKQCNISLMISPLLDK